MRMNDSQTLVFGGRIYTLDNKRPVCDAMIVRDGRIIWLGTAGELSAVPSDRYQMVDLDGRVVFPGFIDSHTHIIFWAMSRFQIDLDGAKSYEDALGRVKSHLKNNPPKRNSWIIGKGWKREQWAKIRWPHRDDLDKLTPHNPAAIFSKDEHLLWANSIALKIAGIDRLSSDPAGGEIMKDSRGEPTGVLKDTAYKLVLDHYVRPSFKEVLPAIESGFEEMYRLGCVGVTSFDTLDGFEVMQALDNAGKLPVKVVYYLPAAYLEDAMKLRLRSGFGSDHLKIGGIKIFSDGALGSQTALMLKPFKGSKDNCGLEVTSPKELKNLIGTANKAGLACAIHAIGDLANRNVLDAYESISKQPRQKLRNRIEHCQILNEADVPRFKKLGIIASVQPSHATADIDIMKRYLGERQRDSYRMRSLFNLGIVQCFGSDAPIEELHPLYGIYAAVTGRRIGGRESFNNSETVTIDQALRGFTIEGARAVGAELERGSLAVGKAADFIMLDHDLTRIKPEKILDTKIVATYIDGQLKYSGDGFPD